MGMQQMNCNNYLYNNTLKEQTTQLHVFGIATFTKLQK
jgi:hypothetical protein